MINNKKNILNILGFKRNNYSGMNNYISEENYNLSSNDKIYLFLENLDNNRYFAKLDLNTKNTNKVESYFKKPIESLSGLNLKFKYSDDPKINDYYHFNNKPHKLTFEVLTKQI